MTRFEALQEIQGAVQNPLKPIARWKERTGAKVVGCLACMPPFVPEELIHAEGMLPVGLWGAEIPVRLADAKLQSFACSVARTSLEMGLGETLSVCDAFLFPSTCDAFQNLSEVWQATTEKPCFKVTYPRKAAGEAASRYLQREFELLRGELAGFSGATRDDQALGRSVQLYNETRRLLRGLDERRAREPGFLSVRQMTEVVMASSFLPREECAVLLRTLLDSSPDPAERAEPPAVPEAVRVFLTGVMARPGAISAALEALGVWVVGDDLGLGALYYSIEIPEKEASLADVVQGYLRYPPCSTLYPSSPQRAAALIDRVRETRADGVLILATKFCEPEFFDHPQLREDLEANGVSSVLIETELGMTAPGSVQTRVEAFIETLRERKKAAL
jgi:benzoyl-CoA reductase/2-hydroxyglutaryl-CoA dehydratase subunit BcrC/BadD/HgdB